MSIISVTNMRAPELRPNPSSMECMDMPNLELGEACVSPQKLTSNRVAPLCPETAYKVLKSSQKVHAFIEKAMEICTSEHSFFTDYRGSEIKIVTKPILGSGVHHEVVPFWAYDVETEEELPAMYGFGIDELLIKYPKIDELKRERNGFMSSVKNTLVQYADCLDAGIPTACFPGLLDFIEDPEFQDLRTNHIDGDLLDYVQKKVTAGFYFVEKIPYAFPNESTFNPKSSIWIQLKALFQLAYDNGIPLDLTRDNVRITADGKAVVTDFMEHSERDRGVFFDKSQPEENNPFIPLISNCIKSFVKNPKLAKWLKPKNYTD